MSINYCLLGTYKDETTMKCIKCRESIQNCITCMDSHNCTLCNTGYELVNGVCKIICPFGSLLLDFIILIKYYKE